MDNTTPTKPELLGMIIEETRHALEENIGWLDRAFGRAERLVKLDAAGRRVYTPAIHVGGNEYKYLTPGSDIGNFSFFHIPDPWQVDWMQRQAVGITAPFRLILWWDYRRIYNDAGTRDIDNIVKEVLDLLNGGFWLRSGRLKAERVYTLAENIYQGYTLDETDNQFLMHPYGGMRIDGIFTIKESCTP